MAASEADLLMKEAAELHGEIYIPGLTGGSLKLHKSFELPVESSSSSSNSSESNGNSDSVYIIRQVGSVNQFHNHWNHLICKYNTASAICGYTAIAGALIVAAMSEEEYKARTTSTLELALSDISALDRGVEYSMSEIQKDRVRYTSANASSFKGAKEIDAYKKAWVANYEISDFLMRLDPKISKHIIFVRFNQISQIHTATHEERQRLEEEREFGTFIIETFASIDGVCCRKLNRPEAILISNSEENEVTRAAIIDLNGHFAVGVPFRSQNDGNNEFILFNTSDFNYLSTVGAQSTRKAAEVLLRL